VRTAILAGLRAHVRRLIATGLAVVLGVGFVAGTLIFGDTAEAALYNQFARAARNVDLLASGRGGDLAPATVDTVRAVPGVAAADGRVETELPMLDRRGRLVGNGGRAGLAIHAGTHADLRPYDLHSGRTPERPGEVALDEPTARQTRYGVGDTITVLDRDQQRRTLVLVGVIGFGASRQYADRSVLALTMPDLAALAGAGGYRSIVIMATADGPTAGLRDAVERATGAEVVTGNRYRTRLAEQSVSQVQPFLTALLAFAVVACVVAAFVIYNTFTILVAQRSREFALLRCVGAARRQVVVALLVESAAIGVVGALAGIALGTGVAYGLFDGMNALGAELPRHDIVFTPTPFVVAILLGVVVTVCSAVLPALRAGRVAPVAALRTAATADVRTPRGKRLLIAAAALTGIAGTALTVLGMSGLDPQAATFTVIAGGLVNFLALLIVSPLWVAPLVSFVGLLPGRLFGPAVRLGALNARRNPGRTAATTAALTIGVGLMASATVLVATVQETATRQIDTSFPVDYMLTSADIGEAWDGVPAEVATRLRERPEFAGVWRIRTDVATLPGAADRQVTLASTDPVGPTRPALRAGSWDRFGPGTAIVANGQAAVGDRMTVRGSSGAGASFVVVGVLAQPLPVGDVIVAGSDFAPLPNAARAARDEQVLVKAAPGVPPTRSREVLEEVLADQPTVVVSTSAAWRAQITDSVNQIIAIVAGLLAFAVVIALIGIVNTLSLSVFERTRESAIGRALGLTRGQLRLTLLVEALLMAAVGAVVGVAYGVLYGWATASVIFIGVEPLLALPVGSLLAYVGIAVMAGAAAAVLPARHAARASIVAAMAET
jgi:putative ABC transport system permease protein